MVTYTPHTKKGNIKALYRASVPKLLEVGPTIKAKKMENKKQNRAKVGIDFLNL